MKALFDTNILIDYLAGVKQAKREIDRFDARFISIISWMEVMVGVNKPEDEPPIRDFLGTFQLLEVTPHIAEKAVSLRRLRKMRLPDALIWASANEANCLLVTRNTKDFPPADPGIRVPYKI